MSKKVSSLFLSGFLMLVPVALSADAAENLSQESVQPAPAESHTETVHKGPFHAFTGKIKGNKVRIRTQPTLDASVVKEATVGDMFVINGEENEFYALAPPHDAKGYVFRTFVLEGVVEGERVNIRLYPDMEAPIIGRLNSGDRVHAAVSPVNSKWLEIDLPSTCHFYVAKDLVENIGPADFLVQIEARKHDATAELSHTFTYAREELQKPFDEINIIEVTKRFDHLTQNYHDLLDIVDKAREASRMIEETYVQKKIAFLESKADRITASNDIESDQMKKLIHMSKELKTAASAADQVSATAGQETAHVSSRATEEVTDKMLVWKPLEDSLYAAWANSHDNESVDEFYHEEEMGATVLTGIVEPYTRPVKNRPGDFILRTDNLPVAFLYSTKVNLQELAGKKITVIAAPRPNNNFAFPAYFVLSVE